MKKLLKNKEGVTLIETVVAVVIFTILGLMVAQVFGRIHFIDKEAADRAEYTMIIDSVTQTIIKDLEEAETVRIGGTSIMSSTGNGKELQVVFPGGITKTYIDTENGADDELFIPRMVINGRQSNVLEPRFYKGKGVDITYRCDHTRTGTPSRIVARTVFIDIDIIEMDADGNPVVIFSKTVSVRPLRLNDTRMGL